MTVPKEIETLDELECFAPGEAGKVSDVTGIIQRRVAPEGMVCSDYCVDAAKRLMEELSWDPDSIDMIIYVPLARDYNEPNTSSLIQDRLGLSIKCIAIDQPMACSGYIYGLSTAAAYLQSGQIKRVLLFAGDTQSKMVSRLDKTLWPINGDSATVTALEYDESAPDINFILGGDGSRYDAIISYASGVREYPNIESFNNYEVGEGIVRNRTNIVMDGMSVFSFAISTPPKAITELMEDLGKEEKDIDFLILHQANKFIDEKIRKKLKFPDSKVPYSINKFGNSSSGTIPVTLVSCLKDKLKREKLHFILCGFGAGLSWGAAYIETDRLIIPTISEI